MKRSFVLNIDNVVL